MRSKVVRCGRVIMGSAVAIFVTIASASAAQPGSASKSAFCASDRDLAALNTRVLQTELMVAALSCDERNRYNHFVTTYKSVLVDQGQALQGLFRRAHGAQGETRMNAFITKLANDASQQIRTRGDDYCVFAAELFDEASATTPGEFKRFADKPWIVSRHGYRPCVVEANRKQPG